MPFATIHSTSSHSIIAGTKAYAIYDQVMRAQLGHVRTKLLASLSSGAISDETLSNQATVLVEWDKSVFANIEAVRKTLHTDNTADNRTLASVWRGSTKHRSISSKITCYATGDGSLVTPFQIFATTACGFNFMGSSQEDLNAYIHNGQLIHPDIFCQDMTLLFSRWLRSLDQMGTEVAIVPIIGGGVYLNHLSQQGQSIALKNIIKALMDAARNSPFTHIREVVAAIPDGAVDHRCYAYTIAVSLLNDLHKKSKTDFSIANVDILGAAGMVNQKGLKAGILNAGSDRTIGGYYAKPSEWNKTDFTTKLTLEELLCNLSDLVLVHSIDKNRFLNSPLVYQHYPISMTKLTHSYQSKEFIEIFAAFGERNTEISAICDEYFAQLRQSSSSDLLLTPRHIFYRSITISVFCLAILTNLQDDIPKFMFLLLEILLMTASSLMYDVLLKPLSNVNDSKHYHTLKTALENNTKPSDLINSLLTYTSQLTQHNKTKSNHQLKKHFMAAGYAAFWTAYLPSFGLPLGIITSQPLIAYASHRQLNSAQSTEDHLSDNIPRSTV